MSVGLICEFNPFHSGHEYIIRRIHELTDEQVICIMSGPFVQRAEPACVNKYARTLAALKSGADAVIELPVKFATAAARNFARGGVEVLKNIDNISSLAFGVETDLKDSLFEIAELKSKPQTDQAIKEELQKGFSYPTAVSSAIKKIGPKGELYSKLLSSPNNILAIEYIDALKNTSIKPILIKRMGSGYNDKRLNDRFASATAIREKIRAGRSRETTDFVSAEMLQDCLDGAPDYSLYNDLLLFAMRKLTIEEIKDLPDVESGLEYVISKAINLSSALSAIESIKSKRYTYSRLRRIFLYSLLGLNKQIMSDIISVKTRLLGIKEESKELLRHFSPNIVTRNSHAPKDFFTDKSVKIDAFADDIYSLLTKKEAGEYHSTPIITI